MYAGRFEFGIFNGPHDERDAALSMRAIVHSCDFLFRCDVDYLLAYPNGQVPRLYESGVFYQTPESPCGGDVWQDIPTLLKRGFGDCKDLACYLAAERCVFDRIYCKPIVRRRWISDDFALYHVVVMYPDGSIEDPSEVLGMPSALAA